MPRKHGLSRLTCDPILTLAIAIIILGAIATILKVIL